jgi:spoIIIJ-associated protein
VTPLEVEVTGETVGEAKWLALRELEKLDPSIDKAAVSFQVVSEGQRGLLGVGYAPARVIARAVPGTAPKAEIAESALAERVRDVLDTITKGIEVRCRIEIEEDDETLTATLHAPELGRVIGKHGQTIDAIQYLVNAIVYRVQAGERKSVVVDAAGYRERRRSSLESLAVRNAERAIETGRPVELEPMSAVERKVVHLRLQDFEGVETRSEGTEPNRFVVIVPA